MNGPPFGAAIKPLNALAMLRLGNAPVGMDAAAALDHHVVFAPLGKQSMLDGGVGCVRLKPTLDQTESPVVGLGDTAKTGAA